MKKLDKKQIHEAAILQRSPSIREQTIANPMAMRPNQNRWKWPPGILNSSWNISGEEPDPQQSLTKSPINKNNTNTGQSYFNIMKKQISIFTFMIMALFAISMGTAFGQTKAIHDSDPETNVLTSDALHPVAGKKYNYSILIPPGVAGNYSWWSTKDPNFIGSQGSNNMSTKKLTVGASNDIVAASAAYGTSTATSNVDITWSSNVLLNTGYQGVLPAKTPTFVVVQFDATSGSCANNLKVYELNPKNGFIVDIRNLNNTTFAKAAYDDNTSIVQCIDKVSKATYNPTTHKMEYEYGTNIFYYEVVAANFSESYKPFLTFSGLDPVQSYKIEWTYKSDFTNLSAYTSGSTVVATDVADNSTGVSIYVKVTVVNHNYEGIADKKVTLTLDGQNKDGSWDIVNSTAAETSAADNNDFAIQTLKARPAVTGSTPTTITAAPTNIITGNESNN
jgi:hypothetical protein